MPPATTDRLPNLQPTLVGETVLLRPLRAEDRQEMFAAASDPLIWELHPVRDRYKEPVFRAYFDESLATKGALTLLERATGSVIGLSCYYEYHPERSEIEIGRTFLVRRHWGGATNREVKRLMLDHALTFVHTVVFWVGDANWRSQRAVEKIGGIRRDGLAFRQPGNGVYQSSGAHVVFEIRKAHWGRG
jgi:N-acetyltransferase